MTLPQGLEIEGESMQTDYLILGSGLSALVFGALMAKSGRSVQVLEAHEYPGGFGHTFTMAKQYHFNAQLHYVWDCGEDQTVNQVFKTLGLDQAVTFKRSLTMWPMVWSKG